jgi:hypothetical protein
VSTFSMFTPAIPWRMGSNQLHRAVQVSKLQHKLFPEAVIS